MSRESIFCRSHRRHIMNDESIYSLSIFAAMLMKKITFILIEMIDDDDDDDETIRICGRE